MAPPRGAAQQRTPPPDDRPRTTPAEPPPLTPTPAPPKIVSPEEMYDTSDGRTSFRIFYWYNPTDPKMFTGKAAEHNVDSTLSFEGKSKPSPGAELSFPAGKFNTLRFSYFRTQGSGNTTSM